MSLRALPGRRRCTPFVLLGVLLLAGLALHLSQVRQPTVAQAQQWSVTPEQQPTFLTAASGPATTSHPGLAASSQPTAMAAATATTSPATPAWYSGARADGNQTFKPDDGNLIVKTLASVLVILVLAVPLIWLSRRLVPRIGAHAGKRMSLLETMYLGPRKTVHLVSVGSRRYLLGNHPEGISLLAEVTDALDSEREVKP